MSTKQSRRPLDPHATRMQRVAPDRFESDTYLDGIPDVALYREGRTWVVSYRTSAMVTRFTTLKAALAYIET